MKILDKTDISPIGLNFGLSFLILLHCLSCQSEKKSDAVITEKGVSFILEVSDLPEYEKHIDHARLVASESEEFYHKGQIVYRNVCFNCHGNKDQEGSMPNSLKFWADSLRHGADPYSIYETLTRGYGMMAPQTQLTPQEKYEVINFIRYKFIKDDNPSQFFEVDSAYLASLPKGDTIGPEPKKYEPWAEMDYGDFLMRTYELADDNDPPQFVSGGRSPIPNEDYRDLNFAYKGIAIRLNEGDGGVAAGNAFALFDHDLLRFTGFWTGEGFINYRDILLNDEHNIYPRTVGTVQVENPITPGWANPETGSFIDPRFVAVDGRPFGPLPKKWAHYKGLYCHGQKVIIHYTVGEAEVLESYGLVKSDKLPIVKRTLNITANNKILKMQVAPLSVAVQLRGDEGSLVEENGYYILKIPAHKSAKINLFMAANASAFTKDIAITDPEDLSQFTHGGPARYVDQVLKSPIQVGTEIGAYAEDVFILPKVNPWNSRMRLSGIDFIKGGKEAIVCTIDGEVYRLTGITQKEGMISWHRIATGLFQPLGIKYYKGEIYVGCRDQIVILKDLNGDGETDFYESFNSDHQVTEHFHEFAMGLQTDKEGNFYYAKSGRHARRSLVPQHGTLLKVSPDGKETKILASGFRAANGVCLNPDGSFYVTDQEGFWNPMNRINRVTEGGFYGNMYGYNPPADSSDAAMIHPIAWVDMKYDRSPAELLWIESERWGPLNGGLLNLSYGYGKAFVVLPQDIEEVQQGGMIELPIPRIPTGLMRGRFNPSDGQLYACGMSAWATSQMIQVGGLYRIRYTGKPLDLPVKMSALKGGIQLTFSDALDIKSVKDITNFTINTWELKRTRNYGSKRYNPQTLIVEKLSLSQDGKTIFIHIPSIRPTWCMEILYELKSEEGRNISGAVHNTIYELPDRLVISNGKRKDNVEF